MYILFESNIPSIRKRSHTQKQGKHTGIPLLPSPSANMKLRKKRKTNEIYHIFHFTTHLCYGYTSYFGQRYFLLLRKLST